MGFILNGDSYTYVLKAYHDFTQGIMVVLVKLNERCDIVTKEIPLEQVISLVNNGAKIENISKIEDGELKFRGGKTLEDYMSNGSVSVICLGEIGEPDSPDSYLIVDGTGVKRRYKKSDFYRIVEVGCVHNYTIANQSIRRMPNQRVANITSKSTIIKEVHKGMDSKGFTECLTANGFRLGYSSKEYELPSRNGVELWQDFCWYSTEGAIVFYNQYNGAIINGTMYEKRDPFYSKCILVLDGEFTSVEEMLSQSDISSFGTCVVTSKGHQRLKYSVVNGTFRNYSKLKEIFRLNNPWDFEALAINTDSSWGMTCKDIAKSLEKLSKRVIESEKENLRDPNLALYNLTELVATKKTVDKFTGELRKILGGFDNYFIRLIREEIGSSIVNEKYSEAIAEKFLVGADIDLGDSVHNIVVKYKQQTEGAQRAGKSKLSMDSYASTTPKSGILGLIDRFNRNK